LKSNNYVVGSEGKTLYARLPTNPLFLRGPFPSCFSRGSTISSEVGNKSFSLSTVTVFPMFLIKRLHSGSTANSWKQNIQYNLYATYTTSQYTNYQHQEHFIPYSWIFHFLGKNGKNRIKILFYYPY